MRYKKIPINQQCHLRGWGTDLDDLDTKSTPPAYTGKSFYEASHDDIDNFMALPDEEKWLMAYWVERQNAKSAGRVTLIIGFVLGAIVTSLLLQWL